MFLIVDLCDEKNEECFVLSGDGDIGVDLIGDGGDYKMRLEYQRIKFNRFFLKQNKPPLDPS